MKNRTRKPPKQTLRVRKETWGTLSALSKQLGVSIDLLRKHASSARSMPGKTEGGQLMKLYALRDMRRLINSRSEENFPKIGKDGMVTIRGEKWMTPAAIAKDLGRNRPQPEAH